MTSPEQRSDVHRPLRALPIWPPASSVPQPHPGLLQFPPGAFARAVPSAWHPLPQTAMRLSPDRPCPLSPPQRGPFLLPPTASHAQVSLLIAPSIKGKRQEGRMGGEEVQSPDTGSRDPGTASGPLSCEDGTTPHVGASHSSPRSLALPACDLGEVWEPLEPRCLPHRPAPGGGCSEQRLGSACPAEGGAPQAGGGAPGERACSRPGEAAAAGGEGGRVGPRWGTNQGLLVTLTPCREFHRVGRWERGSARASLGVQGWSQWASPVGPWGRGAAGLWQAALGSSGLELPLAELSLKWF